MSIFRWVRAWTGACLFAAPILIVIIVFICGVAYLNAPTEDESMVSFGERTGYRYATKDEVKSDILVAFKVVGILIPCIYALGALLGSAIVTGFNLLTYDEVRFK